MTATVTRHLVGKILWRFSSIGGAHIDVIAPPPGELFSETNDNSVAILLATTRGLKRSSTFRNYTHSEPRFRALLSEGGTQMIFHRDAADLSGEVLA